MQMVGGGEEEEEEEEEVVVVVVVVEVEEEEKDDEEEDEDEEEVAMLRAVALITYDRCCKLCISKHRCCMPQAWVLFSNDISSVVDPQLLEPAFCTDAEVCAAAAACMVDTPKRCCC